MGILGLLVLVTVASAHTCSDPQANLTDICGEDAIDCVGVGGLDTCVCNEFVNHTTTFEHPTSLNTSCTRWPLIISKFGVDNTGVERRFTMDEKWLAPKTMDHLLYTAFYYSILGIEEEQTSRLISNITALCGAAGTGYDVSYYRFEDSLWGSIGIGYGTWAEIPQQDSWREGPTPIPMFDNHVANDATTFLSFVRCYCYNATTDTTFTVFRDRVVQRAYNCDNWNDDAVLRTTEALNATSSVELYAGYSAIQANVSFPLVGSARRALEAEPYAPVVVGVECEGGIRLTDLSIFPAPPTCDWVIERNDSDVFVGSVVVDTWCSVFPDPSKCLRAGATNGCGPGSNQSVHVCPFDPATVFPPGQTFSDTECSVACVCQHPDHAPMFGYCDGVIRECNLIEANANCALPGQLPPPSGCKMVDSIVNRDDTVFMAGSCEYDTVTMWIHSAGCAESSAFADCVGEVCGPGKVCDFGCASRTKLEHQCGPYARACEKQCIHTTCEDTCICVATGDAFDIAPLQHKISSEFPLGADEIEPTLPTSCGKWQLVTVDAYMPASGYPARVTRELPYEFYTSSFAKTFEVGAALFQAERDCGVGAVGGMYKKYLSTETAGLSVVNWETWNRNAWPASISDPETGVGPVLPPGNEFGSNQIEQSFVDGIAKTTDFFVFSCVCQGNSVESYVIDMTNLRTQITLDGNGLDPTCASVSTLPAVVAIFERVDLFRINCPKVSGRVCNWLSYACSQTQECNCGAGWLQGEACEFITDLTVNAKGWQYFTRKEIDISGGATVAPWEFFDPCPPPPFGRGRFNHLIGEYGECVIDDDQYNESPFAYRWDGGAKEWLVVYVCDASVLAEDEDPCWPNGYCSHGQCVCNSDGNTQLWRGDSCEISNCPGSTNIYTCSGRGTCSNDNTLTCQCARPRTVGWS